MASSDGIKVQPLDGVLEEQIKLYFAVAEDVWIWR